MLKPDRFSCSQKIRLKWDPSVAMAKLKGNLLWVISTLKKETGKKWTTMDKVFDSITFYADQSNNTRIYAKPEYRGESTIWVSEVNQRQGFPWYQQKRQSYTWKDGYQKQNDSKHLCFSRNQQQVDSQQQGKANLYEYCKNKKEMGSLKCYHCKGLHYISQCKKYQKERNRYQEKHEDIKKKKDGR